MDQEPDYYAILHLEPGCSQEDIREQFKRMVKVFHPDQHKGDLWCEQQLRLCNKAYAVLGDPDNRHAYNQRIISSGPKTGFAFDSRISPQPDRSTDMGEPWTFSAPEPAESGDQQGFVFESTVRDEPEPAPLQFGQESVSVVWPTSKTTGTGERNKLSKASQILVGATAIATIIALFLILAADNQGTLEASSQLPVGSAGSDIDAQSLDLNSPTITAPQPDIQQSVADDKARVQEASKDISPYWTRYELDRQLATRVISDAGHKVHGVKRHVLTNKSEALLQTTNSIQYQFDDITYGAQPDEPVAAAQLADKLTNLEDQIRDIKLMSVQAQKAKMKASALAASHSATLPADQALQLAQKS